LLRDADHFALAGMRPGADLDAERASFYAHWRDQRKVSVRTCNCSHTRPAATMSDGDRPLVASSPQQCNGALTPSITLRQMGCHGSHALDQSVANPAVERPIHLERCGHPRPWPGFGRGHVDPFVFRNKRRAALRREDRGPGLNPTLPTCTLVFDGGQRYARYCWQQLRCCYCGCCEQRLR
jgi:hypothetical protein